jgi:hypothetical protein
MRLKHVKGAEEIIKKGTYYIDNPKELKGFVKKEIEKFNEENGELIPSNGQKE